MNYNDPTILYQCVVSDVDYVQLPVVRFNTGTMTWDRVNSSSPGFLPYRLIHQDEIMIVVDGEERLLVMSYINLRGISAWPPKNERCRVFLYHDGSLLLVTDRLLKEYFEPLLPNKI